MIVARFSLALSLLVPAAAIAAGPSRAAPIAVRDVAGTGGKWQEALTVVDAPAADVREWMLDYSHWKGRFPDIKSVQVKGTTPDGRTIVHFDSTLLGRPITIYMRPTTEGFVYEGTGTGVTTQGRAFITDIGGGRSQVVLQTSGQLHGVAKWVIGDGEKRKRATSKLDSDLVTLQRLAATKQYTR